MNTETVLLKSLHDGETTTGLTPVPKRHKAEAQSTLNGADSVMVDMTKDTPLNRWAQQNEARKKNSKKAMQKSSKRQNRK